MPELDPVGDILYLVRMSATILSIVLIMYAFFSFRVIVKDNDMTRFQVEVSDALASSELAAQRSVYRPEKLSEAEQRGVSLYARNCEFEYSVEIESAGARRTCEKFITNQDCKDYCIQVLGTTDVEGRYDCNFELFNSNFCQCEKDGWHDGYYWKLGYTPKSAQIKSEQRDFIGGLMVRSGKDEKVLPAKITIKAYDSYLTRISCIVQKAYETKENVSMPAKDLEAVTEYTANTPSGRTLNNDLIFRNRGDYLCFYRNDGSSEIEMDCRYMPGVQVKRFEILGDDFKKMDKKVIVAYPLNMDANCASLNPSVIASGSQTVQMVILCVEGQP